MTARRLLSFGLGVVFVFGVVVGLAFASETTPPEEPVDSPYFRATLQQAVDELDGKAARPGNSRAPLQGLPTQHYTTDANLWPECSFGFTRDLVQWPWCHFTSDPDVWPEQCDIPPWPTTDFTWDNTLWPACGPEVTYDPALWCDPLWTVDPQMGPQCEPAYTTDPRFVTLVFSALHAKSRAMAGPLCV